MLQETFEEYFLRTQEKQKPPDYGLRVDGTPKGLGFFGPLQRPDGDVSTELSFSYADSPGGVDIEAPLLVPTLTQKEIDLLLSGGKPTEEIYRKATEHSRMRIANGLSPFAQPGEQKQSGRESFEEYFLKTEAEDKKLMQESKSFTDYFEKSMAGDELKVVKTTTPEEDRRLAEEKARALEESGYYTPKLALNLIPGASAQVSTPAEIDEQKQKLDMALKTWLDKQTLGLPKKLPGKVGKFFTPPKPETGAEKLISAASGFGGFLTGLPMGIGGAVSEATAGTIVPALLKDYPRLSKLLTGLTKSQVGLGAAFASEAKTLKEIPERFKSGVIVGSLFFGGRVLNPTKFPLLNQIFKQTFTRAVGTIAHEYDPEIIKKLATGRTKEIDTNELFTEILYTWFSKEGKKGELLDMLGEVNKEIEQTGMEVTPWTPYIDPVAQKTMGKIKATFVSLPDGRVLPVEGFNPKADPTELAVLAQRAIEIRTKGVGQLTTGVGEKPVEPTPTEPIPIEPTITQEVIPKQGKELSEADRAILESQGVQVTQVPAFEPLSEAEALKLIKPEEATKPTVGEEPTTELEIPGKRIPADAALARIRQVEKQAGDEFDKEFGLKATKLVKDYNAGLNLKQGLRDLENWLDKKYGARQVEEAVKQKIMDAKLKKLVETELISTETPTPETDHAKLLVQVIKKLKPLRKEQQALYSKGYAKRFAEAYAIEKRMGGLKGYKAALKALSSEYEKVQFESVHHLFSDEAVDFYINTINESPYLTYGDSLTAKDGLMKILGEKGAALPTTGELYVLRRVFGSDFTDAVMRNWSTWKKIKKGIYEVANIPRSFMASFDLSAPFRQGLFMINRKEFYKSFASMFKYFGSEKAYKALAEEIANRPTYKMMRAAKLPLTEMGRLLGTREERFMSSWAERIPVLGIGIKASDRAYTGFLNKLRADTFDSLVKEAEKLGLDPENNPHLTDSIATFIGTATGRGSLGNLERSGTFINSFFFSPRLVKARLDLLNPVYYAKLHPFARKQVLKSLISVVGAGTTLLGLAVAAKKAFDWDIDVGDNPLSTDYGKIKIGNTRIDIWGGFQQYAVLVSRFIANKSVSSTTGRVTEFGKGYRAPNRLSLLGRAVEYKEAPVVSFASALLKGQGPMGEKLSIPKEILDRVTPMVIQDLIDIAKDDPDLLPLTTLGVFGMGLQTYAPRPPKKTGKEKKEVPAWALEYYK